METCIHCIPKQVCWTLESSLTGFSFKIEKLRVWDSKVNLTMFIRFQYLVAIDKKAFWVHHFLTALCKWSRVVWCHQLSWWRKLATVKSLRADDSSISPSSGQMIALWRRANARNVSFVTLYGVQFNVINSVGKTKLLCYTLPPHHSFFRNLPSIVMQMNTVCFVAQSLTTYALICFL